MEKETIHCPGPEHSTYKKVLIFKGDNEIFVNCKAHGWVGIKFLRSGKPVSFKGTAIEIAPAKWDHIESKEAATLSVGKFKKARKSKDK